MTSDMKLLPLPPRLAEYGETTRSLWQNYARACIEADRKAGEGRAFGRVVEMGGRFSFIPIDYASLLPAGAKQTLVYTHPAPDDVARLVAAARQVQPFVATQSVGCHGEKCREPWCHSCCSEEDADAAAQRGCDASFALNEALAPFTATQQESSHD